MKRQTIIIDLILYLISVTLVAFQFIVFCWYLFNLQVSSALYAISVVCAIVLLLFLINIRPDKFTQRLDGIQKSYTIGLVCSFIVLYSNRLLVVDQPYVIPNISLNPASALLLSPLIYGLNYARFTLHVFVLDHSHMTMVSAEAFVFFEVGFKTMLDYVDVVYFALDSYRLVNNSEIKVKFGTSVGIAIFFPLSMVLYGINTPKISIMRREVVAIDVFLYAKHSCLVSIIIVNIPLFICRILILMRDSNYDYWLIKNLIFISANTVVRYKSSVLERRWLRKRVYDNDIPDDIKALTNQIPNTLSMTIPDDKLSDLDKDIKHGSYALLLEGIANESEMLLEDETSFLPGENRRNAIAVHKERITILKNLADSVQSTKDLPLREMRSLLKVRRAIGIALGGSLGGRGSNMIIDREEEFYAEPWRGYCLCGTVILYFAVQIILIILKAFISEQESDPFDTSNGIDKDIGEFDTYCLYMAGSTKSCITIGAVILATALTQFILLSANGPFFEAIGQGVYNFIKLTSYIIFTNSVLHHQLFSLSYSRSDEVTQASLTFTNFTNFIIIMPPILGMFSVMHPFYDLLFGRSGITRKNENASGYLEKKAQELLINTTKSNFGHTNSLFINTSTYLAVIYSGCRHQILPASYNYLLMGPNRIKSIRCADSLNRMQWITFTFKILSRIWIFTYLDNQNLTGYLYLIDIIAHLVHNILSTIARYQGLSTSETQSIYSLLSDIYKFCEDVNLDDLAEDELDQIMDNFINSTLYKEAIGTYSLNTINPVM